MAILTRHLFPSDQWWLIGSGSLFLVLYFALLLQAEILLIGIASSSLNRVVVIVQSLNPGGIERCVTNLVEGLYKSGVGNARVLAYDHAPSDSTALIDRMRSQGIAVTAYKKKGGFSVRTVVTLLGCALQDGVMNFHTHDIGGLMYASFVKILTLGRARIVHTQHSFIHLAKNGRYVWYERFFTMFASHVCAVSDEVADQYLTFGIRRRRPAVIYNGVQFLTEPSSAHSRESRQALLESHGVAAHMINDCFLDGTWVLYLARVHPGKGQRELLDIWKHVPEETRRRCHLLIVGPASDRPEQEAIEEFVNQHRLADSVHFIGAASKPELWLGQADCFVSYSLAEGLPLAPLEAAGAGLLTILSEIRGHEFLLDHADFLPLYAPEAAASILDNILSSASQFSLSSWKERYENRAFLRDSFSLNRMMDRYSHLYWKHTANIGDA
jgi:glycosyltransferase involved in cell wall biosynthesis